MRPVCEERIEVLWWGYRANARNPLHGCIGKLI